MRNIHEYQVIYASCSTTVTLKLTHRYINRRHIFYIKSMSAPITLDECNA